MENIPKETETIAAKRSLRLAEKIRHAKEKIVNENSWWNTTGLELAILTIIFLLNSYSIYHYFGTTTSSDTFFSGPIIPLLAKLITFFGVPLINSFQLVNIMFFLLFPFSFYYLIKAITGRKISAFLSVLVASLPFYPLSKTRVLAALNGMDGAHIASLALICLSILALYYFLKKGGAKNLALTSLLSALVVLISPFGFLIYFIFSVLLTFSEVLLGNGRLKIFRLISALFFAITLVTFWYNPSFLFWMLTGDLGEEVRRTISKLIPISLFAVPTVTILGYLLFDRKPNLQPIFLASFFTISFVLISFAGGGIFPSHPSRYVPELGISLAYLISIILLKAYESLPFFNSHRLLAKGILTTVFISLVTGIILGKDNLIPNQDVLGLWTGVEKGVIWQEKEKFNGLSSIIGVGITFFSIFFLSFIYREENKKMEGVVS